MLNFAILTAYFFVFINAQDSQTCTFKSGIKGICIPYYLCNSDKIIVTDGSQIIDKRFLSTRRNKREADDSDSTECSVIEECCTMAEKETVVENKFDQPQTDKTPLSCILECGVSNGPNNKLTASKNTQAEFGDFPWMTGIFRYLEDFKRNVYKCGGSLIHHKVVLTNAECVKEIETNPNIKYRARFGEYDVRSKTEPLPHQDRAVIKIVIHENFNTDNAYNDIALLFLDKPPIFTENVGIICLPPQSNTVEISDCFASGWGKDKHGKNGTYQAFMKKLDLPVVEHSKCQDELRKTRLGFSFNLNKSFVCAGGIKGKDLCTGDAGAPLVCPMPGHTDKYMQVGIMSWGIGCQQEIPGVYTNVPSFKNWIDYQLAHHLKS